MNDWVFWGSILSVIGALAVLVYLVFKVVQLMKQDEERHKQQ
jgi:uncharacterized membrane protein